MNKIFFLAIFCVNVALAFGQSNDLFPGIELGMTIEDFRENLINNENIGFQINAEFSSGRVNGFAITFTNILNWPMFQEYHFLDGRLVGCTSFIIFNARDIGTPTASWFASVFNGFITQFSDSYGNFVELHNGFVEREEILSIVPEIVLGVGWEERVDLINVKRLNMDNHNKLYITITNLHEHYFVFPQISFIYGTEIFFSDYLNILLQEME